MGRRRRIGSGSRPAAVVGAEHLLDRVVSNIEHGRFERSLSGLIAVSALVTGAGATGRRAELAVGLPVLPHPVSGAAAKLREGAWRLGMAHAVEIRATCMALRDYNHWASIGVLNELLAHSDNPITLADESDPYGQPIARMDVVRQRQGQHHLFNEDHYRHPARR